MKCTLCRAPAEVNDLCLRCSEVIRETVADLPPIPPDVIARIVRILQS